MIRDHLTTHPVTYNVKLTFSVDAIWNMFCQLELLLEPCLADAVELDLNVVLVDGLQVDGLDEVGVVVQVQTEQVSHGEFHRGVVLLVHTEEDSLPVSLLQLIEDDALLLR